MRTESELIQERKKIIIETEKNFANLYANHIETVEGAFLKGNTTVSYRRSLNLNDIYFWLQISPLAKFIEEVIEDGGTTKNITIYFNYHD